MKEATLTLPGGVISWFDVSQLSKLVITLHWINIVYFYCFSSDLSFPNNSVFSAILLVSFLVKLSMRLFFLFLKVSQFFHILVQYW